MIAWPRGHVQGSKKAWRQLPRHHVAGGNNKTLGNGFDFILLERFQSTILGYGMFSLHFLGPNSSAVWSSRWLRTSRSSSASFTNCGSANSCCTQVRGESCRCLLGGWDGERWGLGWSVTFALRIWYTLLSNMSSACWWPRSPQWTLIIGCVTLGGWVESKGSLANRTSGFLAQAGQMLTSSQ